MKFCVAVISHARAESVVKMQRHLSGVEHAWYVGLQEAHEYRSAGASLVYEAGSVCQARNLALTHAFSSSSASFQISDDLDRLEVTRDGKTKQPLGVIQAADLLMEELERTGFKFAGAAPTANMFYFGKWLSTNTFVVGDLICVLPCPLTFDEAMHCKEDYDYTVQHMQRYGGVVRVNGILATFKHRTNKGGGCVPERPQREAEAIARLQAKHPGFFRMNPRRPLEVLLSVRKSRTPPP